MKELNRNRRNGESDKEYKKRLTEFYKSERALLKEHQDIKFRLIGKEKPKDLAEIIWRLNIKSEATYYVSNNQTQCESRRSRTENDLYLLVKYYIDRKITFKFCSEILWNMSCDGILYAGFCNTIHRHTYTPRKVTTTEEEIREYLNKKDLNLKIK